MQKLRDKYKSPLDEVAKMVYAHTSREELREQNEELRKKLKEKEDKEAAWHRLRVESCAIFKKVKEQKDLNGYLLSDECKEDIARLKEIDQGMLDIGLDLPGIGYYVNQLSEKQRDARKSKEVKDYREALARVCANSKTPGIKVNTETRTTTTNMPNQDTTANISTEAQIAITTTVILAVIGMATGVGVVLS